MQELQSHYYGMSECARKGKVDRADLKKIFYNNESTFIFEKYVTKIKGVYYLLEKYGHPVYEEQMLEHILYTIMSQNT